MATAAGERAYILAGAASLLVLTKGDIVEFEVDAVVNAANERMLGGGGVDGAIHRAAGRELYHHCLSQVREVARNVRCPTGEARITPGFKLKAKYIIHTVGPVYDSPEESAPLLASAYKSSLALANQYGLKSLAFPAISTGVYGYPAREAAEVSLAAIAESVGQVETVYYVLFGDALFNVFVSTADRLFPPALPPMPALPPLPPLPPAAPTATAGTDSVMQPLPHQRPAMEAAAPLMSVHDSAPGPPLLQAASAQVASAAGETSRQGSHEASASVPGGGSVSGSGGAGSQSCSRHAAPAVSHGGSQQAESRERAAEVHSEVQSRQEL